jgi:DNA-binding beta-propeller fold protein YncE
LRLGPGVAIAAVAVLAAAAAAHAAPFAYVTDTTVYGVSQYELDAHGLLSPLVPPTMAVDAPPNEVAVSPDGRSVYVTISPFHAPIGGVAQYDVGPGGALQAKSPPVVAGLDEPRGVAVSPDGRSVYVADALGDTVAQYDVGPGGALQAKSPPTVPGGHGPQAVAMSPDGRSVYVTNIGANTVSQYDVGQGGALQAKSPPTVATGVAPFEVAVSPNGPSAYVTNLQDNAISQYDLGPGGALQAKSPPTVAGGDGPFGIAISPQPRVPTTKNQCKHGGWKQFGFKNQGQCIAFVNHHR